MNQTHPKVKSQQNLEGMMTLGLMHPTNNLQRSRVGLEPQISLMLTSSMLYQLSYRGLLIENM